MSNADSTIRPVPGPRWTRKRLIGMLIDCYGRLPVAQSTLPRSPTMPASLPPRCAAGSPAASSRIAAAASRRSPSIGSPNCSADRRWSAAQPAAVPVRTGRARLTRRRPGHPAGLASARVAQRAHRRHRRNPRKALAPGRCHQSQQASTGRTPAPRHLAGQRHATVTVSRTGTNACGDDPPTSLADPPHTAATIAGPNTGVDGRRAASGSRGLSRINRPIVRGAGTWADTAETAVDVSVLVLIVRRVKQVVKVRMLPTQGSGGGTGGHPDHL